MNSSDSLIGNQIIFLIFMYYLHLSVLLMGSPMLSIFVTWASLTSMQQKRWCWCWFYAWNFPSLGNLAKILLQCICHVVPPLNLFINRSRTQSGDILILSAQLLPGEIVLDGYFIFNLIKKKFIFFLFQQQKRQKKMKL